MKLLICAQVVDKNHPILGFFHGWIEEFAKHFEEIHVICLYKGEFSLPANVSVYSLGKEGGKNRIKYVWNFYRHFWRIFFTLRVDYVFFHMGAIFNILAAPFFFLRKIFKTKFYWWKAHGHIDRQGKLALHFVDRVYTSTESGFPIETPKRNIIGQAISTTLFTMPQNDLKRQDIIFVGRIMPVKKLEFFLETYVLLRERGYEMAIQIIGPLDDILYRQKLEAYCIARDINKDVFVGPRTQDELTYIYKSSDIFLNTSVTHSMDKTVVEAMFCGCIPVTSNHAFKDLLHEEGLYIENASAVDYADVIEKILTNKDKSNLRQKLSTKARNSHALSTFPQRIFSTV